MHETTLSALELCRVDPTVRCVFVRWHAVPTLQDRETLFAALAAHPDFQPAYDAMVDLRGVHVNAKTHELIALAEERVEAAFEGEAGRRALVVDDDLSFGIMRMYIARLAKAPGEYSVFRDMADAKKWLGLADDYELPF